ncbi:DUF3961 domain-containing protein [Bacillus cereus]|nr:DUF3961 domain-containing protein [Bacillus cereus]
MFEKMNEFFGLESLADCAWYYGVFIIGTLLFLIDMFIVYIL